MTFKALAAACATAALALGAGAQSVRPADPNTVPPNGTVTPDNSGGTVSPASPRSMPPEIVATPAPTGVVLLPAAEAVIPTRAEVKSDAAAAVRNNDAAHGESPAYPAKIY